MRFPARAAFARSVLANAERWGRQARAASSSSSAALVARLRDAALSDATGATFEARWRETGLPAGA